MRRRRFILPISGLCAVLIVACAGPPPRPAADSTPLASVAATPTPVLLSGSGPEDDTSGSPAGSSVLVSAPIGPTPVASSVAAPTPTVISRQTADPTAVVVFAATPFGGAFSELGSDFMLSAPDATGVSYRFDNSAQLRNLIQTGASADVYVSMDPSQMDSLNQANLLAGAPAVLVRDRLAIVVSQSNPQGIQGFNDLANPGMRFIIPAPNSTTSTAIKSAFARASSDSAYGADFGTRADRNVLARDGDDRQVLDRITAGEVSAGIVYTSSIDPGSRARLQVIAIPDSVSVEADYPIAVLKNATNLQGGQAFMKYALSPAGQDLLSRYGFARAAAASAGP